MQTLSQTILKQVEQTRELFFKEHGKNLQDEKRLFINWYIENHTAPFSVLVSDLSNYYLFISEETIIRYINESK